MNKPHKHKDLIIAWANGAQIQYKTPAMQEWDDIAEPSWVTDCFYRIKPRPVIRTFQVALFKGAEYYTLTVDRGEYSKELESDESFVTWLTDPIPYQVEELN